MATANILTQNDNSYATSVKWFGQSKNFQGYRTPGQNRNQAEFTFVIKLTVSSQTTYTCTTTGNAADIYTANWVAVKLG